MVDGGHLVAGSLDRVRAGDPVPQAEAVFFDRGTQVALQSSWVTQAFAQVYQRRLIEVRVRDREPGEAGVRLDDRPIGNQKGADLATHRTRGLARRRPNASPRPGGRSAAAADRDAPATTRRPI